jgi:hypothetical protein
MRSGSSKKDLFVSTKKIITVFLTLILTAMEFKEPHFGKTEIIPA